MITTGEMLDAARKNGVPEERKGPFLDCVVMKTMYLEPDKAIQVCATEFGQNSGKKTPNERT